MADPTLIRVATSRMEGDPVLGRLRAFEVDQEQTPTIEVALRDQIGAAVDLGQYELGGSSSSSSADAAPVLIQARAIEALAIGVTTTAISMAGWVENAQEGLVRFQMAAEAVPCPQISQVEVAALNRATGRPLFTNRFYMYVNPSLFATERSDRGPLPSEQLRLQLRDSDAADNHLLADQEFDLAELCHALVLVVRAWNSAAPPLNKRENTASFRYTPDAIEGVLGEMYLMAAKHYRRNDLEYSAAGVAVNDKRKAQEYEQIGQLMRKNFLAWVAREKTRLNAEGAFGRVGLYYDPWVYR